MYDFIVVGAGSAGCALANRLSANPSFSVLLIEAGPNDSNPLIHMPGGCAEVLKSKKFNWQFMSTPQKHLDGRVYTVHRGKTLGGSSAANGMVYIRGAAHDYDRWQQSGNNGWSYHDVLPYFKSFEDQQRGANEYHGVDGELSVIDCPSDNELYDYFIRAGLDVGMKPNDDFNGAKQEGIGRLQCTIRNGQRCSAATAFLKPIKHRPNLTIVTGALVHRVLLDNTKKAIGVEYSIKNKTHTAKARKEIILSSGTIGSAHILQLSGIGNRELLTEIGITPIHHLPGVGENLQDHLDVKFRYTVNQPISLNGADRFPKNVMIAWDYFVHKKGMGSWSNIEAGGFAKSSPELEYPDIQLHFVPVNMKGVSDPLPSEHGFTVTACSLRPKSRGSLKAVSNDPTQAPTIDFNFCEHDDDRKVLIEACKHIRRIMSSDVWKPILEQEIEPGPAIQSDDDFNRVLPQITETVYHPVGTCKMGYDDMAVVNDSLQVHGIENLRVADASIMPTVVSGNTNAPSMMIGVKCADMVLKRWDADHSTL